jgi:hypothetical protein
VQKAGISSTKQKPADIVYNPLSLGLESGLGKALLQLVDSLESWKS